MEEMNRNRKFAIGIIAYEPSKNLIYRLRAAIEAGFVLYIFDNSPENEVVRDFCKTNQNCRYFTCGKNVGLGFSISAICAHAYYDSFPALIFFDQDTIFDLSTLEFIEEFYMSNSKLSSSYSTIVFNSKLTGEADAVNRFKLKDVLMAISSGSLFFLENLKKLNWHNETFFVDCVDYEFCLRSYRHNFKIGECSMTPGFDHKAEQPDIKYVIWGKERLVRPYNLKRILDTLSASVRLLFTAMITGKISFFYKIFRYLSMYLFWQLVVRIIK
jgi:rhamnosyltransferase